MRGVDTNRIILRMDIATVASTAGQSKRVFEEEKWIENICTVSTQCQHQHQHHCLPVHISTLQSAGTLSPDMSWMTSPGTRSSARIFAVMPPRIALHLQQESKCGEGNTEQSNLILCDNIMPWHDIRQVSNQINCTANMTWHNTSQKPYWTANQFKQRLPRRH